MPNPKRNLTCISRPRHHLTCISRPRHARSPQRVALDRTKTQSHLHFAPSTRTISAEVCVPNPKRHLTCISRPRHARSPQRVALDRTKTQSQLHFAPSTRAISAEGCTGQIQNAISPAFHALDTHDLRRGLRFVVLRRHRPRLKRERKEEREEPQM